MRFQLKAKDILFIFIDIFSLVISFILAIFFRYGSTSAKYLDARFLQGILVAIPLFLTAYLVFGVYNVIWRYAGFKEQMLVVLANASAGIVFFAIQIFVRNIYLPITLLAILLAINTTLGYRTAFKLLVSAGVFLESHRNQGMRVMIIGAGEGASLAINDMRVGANKNLNPICAIDDDPRKLGSSFSGLTVLGTTKDIEAIAKDKKIDMILLAIPSLTLARKKEILDICKRTDCIVKTLPDVTDRYLGDDSPTRFRDISPEELLGQDRIRLDEDRLNEFYEGKIVLITGGAGNIGESIGRQLLSRGVARLVILDMNESKIIRLKNRLQAQGYGDRASFLVASVKDQNNIYNIFNSIRPDLVFHCATHNRVDIMASNLSETVRNNIFGTYNTVLAANRTGVDKFIYVSSDRAANPVDIHGASRRISEMIVQSFVGDGKTQYTSIRFGNILSSSGEYLTRFKGQMERGGPLTVESRELTRYFMTISDAASLITQVAMDSKGKDIYELDMGEPVRIYDLARDYISLSGAQDSVDIKIESTDELAEGDVVEEILSDPQGVNPTGHERIKQARSLFDNYADLMDKLDSMDHVLNSGSEEDISYTVLESVKRLVPMFYFQSFEELALDLEEVKTTPGQPTRIFLASPHMGGKELEFVKEAFSTNWLAPLGPNVDEFENEIQAYVGIKSAAAMTTGTAAIHMALQYMGVGEGDHVFCSSLTFAGSCNPIIYTGATPVFIDSDYETWNMSPRALKKGLEDYANKGISPKAVIVVNLYGQSADYDELEDICSQYNVPIIEDAAESLGATYKGRKSGTFGKFGIFSFNGNKIITTSGGGILVSNDEPSIKKVKFFITQARDRTRHYQHSELGFNYRMSNVLAGIGRGQLQVLEQRIKEKKAIYDYYKEAFASIPDIEMMPIADFGRPNYWLSVMTLKPNSKVKPLDIMIALEEDHIESRPMWKPMHLQPYYMKYDFFNHNDEGIAVSEDLFDRGVCLPSDTKMTKKDLARITRIVKACW